MSISSAKLGATRGDFVFSSAVLLFMLLSLALTTLAPISASVIIVFLFAGPHNYAEAKYFLTRLPARMGRLKPFFLTSTVGIILLSAAFPLLTRAVIWFEWPAAVTIWLVGLWNTALIFWATALVVMRSRQAPRYDWDYAWPIGIGLMGLTWLSPFLLPCLLVYLHPLMGLWILDRELQKSHPAWQKPFRRCLILLPAILVLQWFSVGNWANAEWRLLPEIHDQISRHVGLAMFLNNSGPQLIATHAFLELLHYGIWLIAIPVVSGKVFSQSFQAIPLMKASHVLRRSIQIALMVSAGIVFTFWVGFVADYTTTRDIYFTVATIHVLAEIPFLLRLL